MFSLIFIILLGEVLFLGFVADQSIPIQTHAETIKKPFNFSISVNKTRYALGEPIAFTVRLNNIGEKNVTFTRTAISDPFHMWFVIDENGQSVFYHASVSQLPVVTHFILKPSVFIEKKYYWNQKNTDGHPVSYGSYYIVVNDGFILEQEAFTIQTRIEILIPKPKTN